MEFITHGIQRNCSSELVRVEPCIISGLVATLLINGYVTHFWITLLLVYIASILITFTNNIHILITTQCVLDFRWLGSEMRVRLAPLV